MSGLTLVPRLVQKQGDFHFAMTSRDEVLLIGGEMAFNLGPADRALERMRDFIDSIGPSGHGDPLICGSSAAPIA